MKIPLNMGNDAHARQSQTHEQDIQRIVLMTQKGDWNAKKKLVHTFMPFITSLAEKRASDVPTINSLTEAGKEGLYKAAKKFKPAKNDNFQIFALDFIESAMDQGKKGGFFSKLFG